MVGMEILLSDRIGDVSQLTLGEEQFSRKKREKEPPYIFTSDKEFHVPPVGAIPTYEIHVQKKELREEWELILIGRTLLPAIPEDEMRQRLEELFTVASPYEFTIYPVKEESRHVEGPYQLIPLVWGSDGRGISYRGYSMERRSLMLLEMQRFIPEDRIRHLFNPHPFYAMIERIHSTAWKGTLEEKLL